MYGDMIEGWESWRSMVHSRLARAGSHTTYSTELSESRSGSPIAAASPEHLMDKGFMGIKVLARMHGSHTHHDGQTQRQKSEVRI